jgi:WD40 repeat protein
MQLKGHQDLFDLVSDARLFLTGFKSVIKTPLQIYHSAILFSPANSLIRKLFLKSEDFSKSLSKWINVLPLPADWDTSVQACKHVLEGHSDWVSTVVFSPDGLLASGSDDKTVRVWDPATGQCKHELKGHSSSIRAVVFSPDGLLASGSNDKTVRVWDPATGQCKHELEDLTLMPQGQHSVLSDSTSPSYSLNAEATWVTRNNYRILSLPDNYHWPTAFAVRGNMMTLGYRYGHLIFLQFSEGINV